MNNVKSWLGNCAPPLSRVFLVSLTTALVEAAEAGSSFFNSPQVEALVSIV